MPSPAPPFSPDPHGATTCEGRELVQEHLPVGYYSLITQDKKSLALGLCSANYVILLHKRESLQYGF